VVTHRLNEPTEKYACDDLLYNNFIQKIAKLSCEKLPVLVKNIGQIAKSFLPWNEIIPLNSNRSICFPTWLFSLLEKIKVFQSLYVSMYV